MFEQDYIMRMIKDMVKILAKIVLDKETVSYELHDGAEYKQADDLYKNLIEMLNKGKINEAEDLLFEEFNVQDKTYFELALDFYLHINMLDDDFLEANNYSREEVEEGIQAISKEFGVSIWS